MFTVIVLENVFQGSHDIRKTFLMIWKIWIQVRGEKRQKLGEVGKRSRNSGGGKTAAPGGATLLLTPLPTSPRAERSLAKGPEVCRVQLRTKFKGPLNPHKVKKEENWLHSPDSLSPRL